MKTKTSKSGTREWADVNLNCCIGCNHDCLYCYAKANALRFHRIKMPEDWAKMSVDMDKYNQKPRLVDGRIMFPTSHDIMPNLIEINTNYLLPWLYEGNQVLIVTKPHIESIQHMTKHFKDYKSQITFRFTIGSQDDEVLQFWEPNAPSYAERMECLKLAFKRQFQTSVSCEPFFDTTIFDIVDELSPFVSDSIWIGKMNHANQRVSINTDHFRTINKNDFTVYKGVMDNVQTDKAIKLIFKTYKNNPKVKWKESIRKVLKLPEPKKVG